MKSTVHCISGVNLPLHLLCLLAFLLSLILSDNSALYASPIQPFDLDESGADSGPWSSFSPSDGLASSSILPIVHGINGELWVGTTGGVSVMQLDETWRTFTDADGLGGNIVTDIVAMSGNPQQWWFGNYGGVSLLDTGGALTDPSQHQWITFSRQDGLVEDWVSAVAIDTSNNIWIGTYFIDADGNDKGFGVSRLAINNTPFDKTDDVWTTYNQAAGMLSNNIVRDILVDDTGVVWIATASGLNAIHNDDWTVYYTGDGLPSNEITALAHHNGLLWIATKGGIAVMDDGGTPGIKADDRWASFTRSNSGLVDNETSSIGIDAQGYVWVGTSKKNNNGEAGSGVNALDFRGTPFSQTDDRWMTYTSSNGLAHNAVRSVAGWGNAQVAFGTRTGLSVLNYNASPFTTNDNKWQKYTTASRLAGSLVTCVEDSLPGDVWLGTEQGLNLLRYNNTPHQKTDDIWLTYTPPGGAAFGALQSLVIDTRGWLWVGSTNGLWIIDSRGTPERSDDDIVKQYRANAGLVHDQVNDIAVDSAGRGWIASGDYFSGGVQVLNPGVSLSSTSDDMWATFTPQNSSLPGANVTSVAVDNTGSAWIGTTTGASQLDYGSSPFSASDDRWSIFRSSSSGLAYDNVRDVLIDGTGNVWFALLILGVSVRTTDGAWQTFQQGDGLAYDSVYALESDANGKIWIGTDGGGVSVLDYRNSIHDKSDDLWTTYAGGQLLLSGNIRAIHVDSWGQVWVGTFGGGASVYSDIQLSQLFLPAIRRR